MRSRLWVNAFLVSLAIIAACALKEQAPVAAELKSAATPVVGTEKTYPLRGKVVSVDTAQNKITVDHEKVEGLWDPMTMTFEVRGGASGNLPRVGSTIRATLHAQGDRYWLTDVRVE